MKDISPKNLAEPLFMFKVINEKEVKCPRVLFAGEATDFTRYGTGNGNEFRNFTVGTIIDWRSGETVDTVPGEQGGILSGKFGRVRGPHRYPARPDRANGYTRRNRIRGHGGRKSCGDAD